MKTIRSLASVLAALGGIAIVGSLVPSTAAAQSACYVPGSGTVYRIKEPNTPAQCSTGHVEFQMTASAKPGSGGPTGAAGGDLGGSYPNPSVVKIQGQPISPTAPSAGQVLTFSAGSWTPVTPAPAGSSLPTNGVGAFDFSNINGFVATGTYDTGVFPASGSGRRFSWISKVAAFRGGAVSGTQWNEGSVGYNSIAYGNDVVASGSQSVAFGDKAQATAASSTALGYNTLASAGNSLASGYSSIASGVTSTALGYSATASGSASVAMGFSVTASGSNSVAMGNASTASGYSSVAVGNQTLASGGSATAVGFHTTASGTGSTALGNYASTNAHMGAFMYGDVSTTSVVSAPVDNSFNVRAQHFWLGTNSSPTATAGRLLETSTGAYLSTGGTWTNTSDVAKKHGFKSIDGEDLLARIDSMPVSTWTYNSESDSVRHMGPTAQDFRRAFGLGDTDKAIATVDADGVALAAVKALLQRTTDLRRENDELRSALAELSRRLADLETARR